MCSFLLFQSLNNTWPNAKKKLANIKGQISELKDLEKSLEWLVMKCPGNSKPDCPIIDELAKD